MLNSYKHLIWPSVSILQCMKKRIHNFYLTIVLVVCQITMSCITKHPTVFRELIKTWDVQMMIFHHWQVQHHYVDLAVEHGIQLQWKWIYRLFCCFYFGRTMHKLEGLNKSFLDPNTMNAKAKLNFIYIQKKSCKYYVVPGLVANDKWRAANEALLDFTHY